MHMDEVSLTEHIRLELKIILHDDQFIKKEVTHQNSGL
jgi:hypothetical protein